MNAAARPPGRRGRALGALASGAVLSALTLAFAAPVAALSVPTAAGDVAEYSETRTLTREMAQEDGSTATVDSRTVTVKVDVTTQLQDRERVRVSWTGAHPTGGRTSDPFGANGLGQEYPVVILLCRGVEDPTGDQEAISPETCWTTSRNERNGSQSAPNAVWAHDLHADPAALGVGKSADPWPAACEPDNAQYRNFLVPFRAANGAVYWQCTPNGVDPATGSTYVTTAPEQATDASLPANDVFASTAPDGTGDMLFEVRTDEVNESLGCSDQVDCALVVIPIMGISCKDQDPLCRKTGIWAPGTLRSDVGDGYDYAVSGDFWWSASNWRNRFTVPLTFAPPPDVCDLLDDRGPVSFYGSELLNQATLQWAPAYCLNEARFKFRHNRSSEALARRQLGTADAAAAFVSDRVDNAQLPVAYAPTAVTGFGIGFVADKADNAGEVTTLRLTPRLVAKLLTESYPATPGVRSSHCDVSGDSDVEVLRSSDVPERDAQKLPLADGACETRSTYVRREKVDGAEQDVEYTTIAEGTLDLVDNPLTITQDPEFTALNPDVPARRQVSEAVLLTLSEDSDVVEAMTSWIANDPKAMAFIAGEPDENGMRVNGYYKDLSLPLGDWPLLDQYVEPTTAACLVSLAASTPKLQLYASPVNTLRKTSEALLESWPYSQVSASNQGAGTPCKWDRPRLSFGARFMLALVPLGDAERLGLRVASLSTASDAAASFQAPTDATMSAALRAFSQDEPGGLFTADYSAMPATAYPGTMVVSTAALDSVPPSPFKALAAADAAHVAEFIRVSTTEGQVGGRGNGELPEGYLPILSSGATAKLYDAAQLSATAIEEQDPSVLVTPTPTPTATATAAPVTPPSTTVDVSAPPATVGLPGAPTSVDGLPADAVAASAPSTSVATAVNTSEPAGAAVPAMLGVAVAGAVGAPLLRLASTRRSGS